MEASTHSTAAGQRMELVKQMRGHEVAVAELGSLSSARAVYQKHGNIFFRTTAQKAKASELSKIMHECILLAGQCGFDQKYST